MSDTGIKQLSKVIEFIKKKKISRAQVEYQTYSKMPSKKCSDYITGLQERVLKGEVDIGNIPDSELELFNEKPSEEDALKRKGEFKRNMLITCVIGLICFVIYLSDGFETNSSSSSSSNSCRLSGCNSTPNGWRYYTGSDLGAYSYSCVRLGPSTGHSYNNTYCSKNHCIQDR